VSLTKRLQHFGTPPANVRCYHASRQISVNFLQTLFQTISFVARLLRALFKEEYCTVHSIRPLIGLPPSVLGFVQLKST